jgi:hypothetical protein
MLNPYEYTQFERWTQRVRRDTQREMHRLRLARARAELPVPEQRPMVAGVIAWWRVVQGIVRGGVPAIERAVLGLLTPRTQPERLLPDATARH